MSNYTIQLREYIESVSESATTREKIEDGRVKLFDFDYPIFDPEYKNVFETNFIRNFYTREIGQETMGLFKFRLETWLFINMPYFNKMFLSELLTFDPLSNTKADTTTQKTDTKTHDLTTGQDVNRIMNEDTDITTTSDGTLTVDNFGRHILSDTPDSRLTLTAVDGEGVIEYASKINENNENNTSTNHAVTGNIGDTHNTEDTTATTTVTGTITNIEDFVYHKAGKIGVQSFSKMLTEYRQTLLRIEKQIFDEMNTLFMVVY